MHSLLMSENDFYSEIKCNRMTSFMEFMLGLLQKRKCCEWLWAEARDHPHLNIYLFRIVHLFPHILDSKLILSNETQ